MDIFFNIMSIVVCIALQVVIVLVARRLLQFVKTTPCTNENDFELQVERCKKFYKHIYMALLVELVALMLSIGAFVGNLYALKQNIPYYNAPIFVLVICCVVLCVVSNMFLERLANKHKIQDYDAMTKKLAPMSSKTIFILCLIISAMHSAVLANSVYAIMALVL